MQLIVVAGAGLDDTGPIWPTNGLETKMTALEEPMRGLGEEMDVLGKQMDALGEQMDRASAKAESDMRMLLDKAIASGIAQKVK